MNTVKLKDISYIVDKGKNVKKEEHIREKGNMDIITFSDIMNGVLLKDLGKMVRIKSENEYMDLKIYGIEEKDIILPIISRKNLIIKQIKRIENTEKKIIYSSRLVYIRANPEKYIPEFLYRILCMPKIKERLLKEVYKSDIDGKIYQISLERLKEFEIPNVSIREQKEILTKEQEIKNQIAVEEEKLVKLYKKFI